MVAFLAVSSRRTSRGTSIILALFVCGLSNVYAQYNTTTTMPARAPAPAPSIDPLCDICDSNADPVDLIGLAVDLETTVESYITEYGGALDAIDCATFDDVDECKQAVLQQKKSLTAFSIMARKNYADVKVNVCLLGNTEFIQQCGVAETETGKGRQLFDTTLVGSNGCRRLVVNGINGNVNQVPFRGK